MSQRVSFSHISLFLIVAMLCAVAGTARAGWYAQDMGGADDQLNDLLVVDEDRLFVAGDGGVIRTSNDGGGNWTNLDSTIETDLNGIDIAQEPRIFAVGDGGIVLRSVDMGSSWDVQTTPSSKDMYAIDMVTQNIGTAVGQDGDVLVTGNSGATWGSKDSETMDDLYGVTHINNAVVWAVGANGSVTYSDDQGDNWTRKLVTTNARLNDIGFLTNAHGFFIGENGTIFETTNNGAAWAPVEIGGLDGEDLYAIDTLDENTAIIVGDGVTLTTVDAGASWSVEATEDVTFSDVVYFSAEIVLATGTMDDGESTTFMLDVTDPTAPTDLLINGGSPSEDANPSFAWTASTDAEGEIDFYIVRLDGGEWETVFTFFDMPNALDAGDYTIEVLAVDEAGNQSEITSLDFTISEEAVQDLSFEISPGTLIKTICSEDAEVNDPCKAVYYYSSKGERHAFSNDKVYFTWYDNFDSVEEVSTELMSSLPLGANVPYKPGEKMVKFITVNTVYVVRAEATLHPIDSEEIAAELYGDDWNTKIDDISDAFFGNYNFGDAITDADDYDVEAEKANASSIDMIL